MADELAATLVGHDLGSRLPAQRLEPFHLLLELAGPALERGDLAGHRVELLLELEHALDARQVHAQLGGHLLDPAQPVDVGLGVQPRALGRALGLDQATSLVHPERLGCISSAPLRER